MLLVGLFSLYSLVGNRYIARTGGSTAKSARDRTDRADGWASWQTLGWVRLGEVQRIAGNDRLARNAFNVALARDSRDYRIWLSLALASRGKARTAAATEALRLNPLAPEINALRPYLGLSPLPGQATTPPPPAAAATTTAATVAAATSTAP